MTEFQIGDFVKVVNKKNILFEYVGVVTKVTKGKGKSNVVFNNDGKIFEKGVYMESVEIKNSDLEKIFSRESEVESKNIIIKDVPEKIIIFSSGKKISLTQLIQEAFPKKYFSELLLFNYMRSYRHLDIGGKSIGRLKIKKGITSGDDLLDWKIKNKEIINSGELTPCVFFTPIPRLLFKKFYLERFSTNYNLEENPFLCLDGKVLCKFLKKSSSNFRRKYWLGVNFCEWEFGPLKLYEGGSDCPMYIFDKCETEPELSGEYRDYFLKCLEMNILSTYFGGSEDMKKYGIDRTFELENKGKFIELIRLEGFECFLSSEIFICHEDWEENVGVKLTFSDEDVLIKNYSGNSGYEEIKKVLKNGK